MNPKKTLEDLRKKIDRIDQSLKNHLAKNIENNPKDDRFDFSNNQKIKTLIDRRLSLALQVGKIKKENRIDVVDLEREKTVIENFIGGTDEPETKIYLSFINDLLRKSKSIQTNTSAKHISLRGEIFVDSDKSILHRAFILAAVADGETIIKCDGYGKDVGATIDCLKQLKIDIIKTAINTAINTDADYKMPETEYRINGKGLFGLSKPAIVLDAKNSGTTMRLLTGLLSAQGFDSVINGDDSLRRRPMDRLIIPLKLMGANLSGEKGKYPPLKVTAMKTGELPVGIEYTLPVASAQVKTAIMLTALYADDKTVIKEKYLSRDHTEILFEKFGMDIDIEYDDEYKVINLAQGLKPQKTVINVPGDFSSAAFLICAALIIPGSDITVRDVLLNPTRTGLLTVLKKMGADIIIDVKKESAPGQESYGDIRARYSNLHGTAVEPENIPSLIDEIPVLAVVAATAEGQTVIKGAEELKHKESNRLTSLETELSDAGIDIRCLKGDIYIRGNRRTLNKNYRLSNSHNDHRIVMAMNVLELMLYGDMTEYADVDISFPGFYSKIDSLLKQDI